MKSLTIYIASSFDESQTCELVRQRLMEAGHRVPDVWWNVRTKNDFANRPESDFYSSPLVQAIAVRHWETIRNCDIVILVSSLENSRSFTGANVEVGFALGLGKPVVSLGKLKLSAMYCPLIQCNNVGQLLSVIDCIGQVQR